MQTTELIKYKLGGFNVPFNYEMYNLQLQYYNGWKNIYSGRSFINADGTTEPRVDKILRDYVWRWNIHFNESTQQFIPECMSTFSDTLAPIEDADPSDARFISTYIKCNFVDKGIQQTYDVTGSFVPFYQKQKKTPQNAFSTNLVSLSSYATISAPLPHIPAKITNNFWVGAMFSLSKGYAPQNLFLSIPILNSKTRIKYRGYGDFAFAYTLSDLFSVLPLPSRDIQLNLSDGNANGYNEPIAIIDACPNKYYLSFITPTCGWQCVGFDSLQIKNTTENDSIVTIDGIDKNIWTNSKNNYTINSPILTECEYRNWCSIPSSYICYLYDVENDRGQYVTCVTNNSENMKSWHSKKQVQLELQDNHTTIR